MKEKIAVIVLVACGCSGCGRSHGLDGIYRASGENSKLYLSGSKFFFYSDEKELEAGTFVQDGNRIRCQVTYPDPTIGGLSPNATDKDGFELAGGGNSLIWEPFAGSKLKFEWSAPLPAGEGTPGSLTYALHH